MYNIEVEGSHCYRVGESGVLVHNASAGDPKVVQIETAHPGIKVDLPATVGNTFRAVDCARPEDFFIKADLNGDLLTFNVITVKSPTDRSAITATEFFTAAMEWFGAGSVKTIKSTWLDVPGFNTNFLAFKGAYNPATDNREDAVKATPTYKIVSKPQFGFTMITSVILTPSKKKFNLVEVEYSR